MSIIGAEVKEYVELAELVFTASVAERNPIYLPEELSKWRDTKEVIWGKVLKVCMDAYVAHQYSYSVKYGGNHADCYISLRKLQNEATKAYESRRYSVPTFGVFTADLFKLIKRLKFSNYQTEMITIEQGYEGLKSQKAKNIATMQKAVELLLEVQFSVMSTILNSLPEYNKEPWGM